MSDNNMIVVNGQNVTTPIAEGVVQTAQGRVASAENTSTQMYLIEQGQSVNHTVEIDIKAGQLNQVQVEPGKKYRVVKKTEVKADAKTGQGVNVTTEELQDQVIAIKHGESLQLSYPNGTVVELAGFYQANTNTTTTSGALDLTSLTLPGDGDSTTVLSSNGVSTGASAISLGQDTYLLYAHGDASTLQGITQGNEVLSKAVSASEKVVAEPVAESSSAPYLMLAGLMGLGGIVAAAASGSKSSSTQAVPPTPSQTVISGEVVLGPVLAGNGLKVLAFKESGALLGSAKVESNGSYQVTYDATYTGAVLLKVIDINGAADYKNEATAADKGLDSNIYAVVSPLAGTTNSVYITPLTTLAAKRVGIVAVQSNLESAVGDLIIGKPSAADIAAANIAIAKENVDQNATSQITAMKPIPIINSNGVAQTGNAYGKALAAISSFENNNQVTTAQAVDLIQSNTKYAAPLTNAIATDNVINIAESTNAVITGTNETGATVALLIGANQRSATVSGTSWTYTLTSADITALGQGAKIITVTQTDLAGKVSANNDHAVTIDTVAPTSAVIHTVATDDIINAVERTAGVTITGTNEVGSTVTVDGAAATVNGTTWSYTMDAATINALGQGAKTLSVVEGDVAGNLTTTTKAISIDTQEPVASAAVAHVPVTGANAHIAVQSTELGKVYLVKDTLVPTSVASITGAVDSLWNEVAITATGTDTSLVTTGLADGIYHLYAADQVGNLSAISSNAITVDAIAPTVQSVTISNGNVSHDLVVGDQVLVTLGMSEAVAVTGAPTYLIDVGGVAHYAAYQSGSGTNSLAFAYTIAAGDSDLSGGITAAANSLLADQSQNMITDLVGNFSNTTIAAVAAGTNTVRVDSVAPSISNASAFSVSNLDITSNIVIKFDSAVTALNTGHISLINDANGNGKTGYYGETNANTIELYFGASSTANGITTVQTFSDSGRTIASGAMSINDATGAVSINPLHDLDLSNNYHLVVAADSFQKTSNGLKNAAIGADSSLYFSTVTTGTATALGDISAAASSSMWGADGQIVTSGSHDWISIEGVGTPSGPVTIDASTLKLGSSTPNYMFVVRNVSTVDNQSAIAEVTGIRFTNFDVGSNFLYVDYQNNAQTLPGAASAIFDGYRAGSGETATGAIFDVAKSNNNEGNLSYLQFLGLTEVRASQAVLFG